VSLLTLLLSLCPTLHWDPHLRPVDPVVAECLYAPAHAWLLGMGHLAVVEHLLAAGAALDDVARVSQGWGAGVQERGGSSPG
jgi:predicted methyltransferase